MSDQVWARMEEEEAVGDRVLEPGDVRLIVETLLPNSVLCRNWTSLWTRLRLKESDLHNWDSNVKFLVKTMNELVTHMMQEWMAQNARPPLRDLLHILTLEDNIQAVDDLRTAFRNDRR